MKFIPLVWAGIWRKRGRSILILAQVVIAFTLFGVLQGLNTAIKQAVDATHADRLYVGNRLRLGAPLPISILPRIEATSGVTAATFRFQFSGTYQKATQGMAIVATDVSTFLPMYPEMQVDPAQVKALKQTQDGVIAGIESMRQYGWKVGQRITLQSPLPRKNGSRDWTFDIVGSYQNTDAPDSAVVLIANYRYVNESLPEGGRDTIALATVHIADPVHAPEVEQAIDRQFANSPNETLTQTEHELAEANVSSIGDLDVVVHRITAATFAVLLFATGALMMQSIRERTPELAVLKTFGFSDPLVMVLILAETLVLCLAGAAIGLGLASRILPLARAFIGIGAVHAIVVLTGLLFATILALAAGAIPAWRGLRLRVVDALADR